MSLEVSKKKEENEWGDEEEQPIEQQQGSGRRQPWIRQITFRGIIASAVIGSIYSAIVMKQNLTVGLVPNLNVSAALLAFMSIKSWTKILHKAGWVARPFTAQENTMIQTCAVACYSIAVGGGLDSYLLGMSKKIYELSGPGIEGNSPRSVKEPGFGWMTGFLFIVCFVGLFVLIPLRKVMIVDLKLTYPSGLATAVLINGFHSQKDNSARKQVRGFVKYFSISFVWGFFQWFFSGREGCGFSRFPTFGLEAYKRSFYFDFSTTNVGAGMICSHLVNLSLLLGAILSFGMMWPIAEKFEGKWYPKDLPPNNMKGIFGYKVFLSVALILGDGLYNFIKILSVTFISMHGRLTKTSANDDINDENESIGTIEKQEFLTETVPTWVGVVGYVICCIFATILIPIIFPQLKWYFVAVAYIFSPFLAFCNAYGAGLTDQNMAFNYSKVALFVLAAISGKENGLLAGLAGCGLIKSVISVSCILMQDFKTAYITSTSPKAMFLSQVIGTAIGCITAPLSFFLFYNAFDVGNSHGDFKAPFALIYRNMAILGVQGVSALPRYCLQFCSVFFALAIIINLIKDLAPKKIGKWMPLPMAVGIPFLVGAYFTIDMCVGSLIVFIWHKRNSLKAKLMVPAVASGLICGEGLWILPASVLGLARIYPPICMKFMPS